MTAAEIVAAARTAIGTPFVHQGRVTGVGLDCAGLVVHVARTIGAEYVDATGYARHPSQGLLEAALAGQPCLKRVALGERQPGDVLLMRFAGDPQHLGVFSGDSVIHSYSTVGQVCEHRLDEAWERRIVQVYRFVGVA